MMRILLADDDQSTRRALALLLSKRLNVQVVGEALDMDQLQAQTRELQPDLLLLDWELPGLVPATGLPALRRLHPSLVVIALSTEPEAQPQALQAGVEAFINKGEPPQNVLDILGRFVHPAPSQNPGRTVEPDAGNTKSPTT